MYAPINLAFVLYHSYLSVSEFWNPVIPGSYFTLAITGGLSVLGIAIAVSVQKLARTMVKSIALLEDGKHVRITFLSAFSVRPTQTNDRPSVIPIEHLRFPEETASSFYRVSVPEVGTLFINFQNNEITDEQAKSLLPRVMQGYYVNTLGNINLNKVIRKE